VLGAVLLAIGGNWLLAELGLFTFGWPGLFAVALMTLGMAMVGTAKAGRTGPLVLMGIVLTVGLAMSSGISSPVRGQNVGDRLYTPKSADQVRGDYGIGAGELTIDLSEVDFPKGQRHIDAEVGVGELRVIVPKGLAVDVTAKIGGGGEVRIFDAVSDDGLGPRGEHRDAGYTAAESRLDLDLDVSAFGAITVVHG